jgi:hypothetical protein
MMLLIEFKGVNKSLPHIFYTLVRFGCSPIKELSTKIHSVIMGFVRIYVVENIMQLMQ